jgi:hypothetical protein
VSDHNDSYGSGVVSEEGLKFMCSLHGWQKQRGAEPGCPVCADEAEVRDRADRRERIATAVIGGLVSRDGIWLDEESAAEMAQRALMWADAMIAELDKADSEGSK